MTQNKFLLSQVPRCCDLELLRPKMTGPDIWEVWVQAKTVLGAFTTGAMLIAVEYTSSKGEIENKEVFENLTEDRT